MRNTLYLGLAATSAVASPLGAHSNNEHEPNGGIDCGVIHHPPPPPYGFPGTCSEGWPYPPWSNNPTASSSSPPVVTPSTQPTATQSTTIETTLSSSATTTIASSPASSTPPSSTLSTVITSGAPPPTSGTSASSTCSTTATPPAATQPGVVAGCSKWYVAESGDYCAKIADQFGIALNTFFIWNPAVTAPDCTSLLAGDAYCVQVCGDTSLTSISTSYSPLPTPTASAPLPSLTQGPNDKYNVYCGDGSEAQGWPSEDDWLEFDDLFEQNRPSMKLSCANWGVPYDTDQEIEDLKSVINEVAQLTGIDRRVILAVIMQESTGCVRVITTSYSHYNPGLMQSFNGTGSCNTNNAYVGIAGTSEENVTKPCRRSMIYQMVLDGTNGTALGPGLRKDFEDQDQAGAFGYYRTVKIYNGGYESFRADETHLEAGCCTSSYVSDIANRLTGWVNAPSTFSCS